MDHELVSAVDAFLDSFELVFEVDWDFSKGMLEDLDSCGCQDSFLRPDTYCSRQRKFDDSNNWANRGGLLFSYRTLISLMMKRGIRDSLEVRMAKEDVRIDAFIKKREDTEDPE